MTAPEPSQSTLTKAKKGFEYILGPDKSEVSNALGEDKIQITPMSPSERAEAKDKPKQEPISARTVKRLKRILREYKDVFVAKAEPPKQTTGVSHRIELKEGVAEASLKRSPMRRFTQKDQRFIEQQIQELMKKGIISKAKKPLRFACQLLVVRKPGKKPRLCVDYKPLNTHTAQDVWPVPRMDDVMSSLAGNKYFTCLDAASGFWQIPLDPTTKHLSAFNTPTGCYVWNVMPMGLRNSPATFCRWVEDVFEGMGFVHCYVDDFTIASKTVSDHLRHIEAVLQRCKERKVHLRLEKSAFLKTNVQLLGHMVSEKGCSPVEEKVKAIKEMQTPTSRKQLKSFLGMVQFYKAYVPGLAGICRPLYKATGAKAFKQWEPGGKEIAAFNKVKKLLSSDTILSFPDFERDFYIRTDASDYGMGATLIQFSDDDKLRVVEYWSKALTDREKSYPATKKEALAMTQSILRWKFYLAAKEFVCITDHKPLLSFLSSKDPYLQRWRLKLAPFSFKVQWQAGTEMGPEDWLSRDPKHLQTKEVIQCQRVRLAWDNRKETNKRYNVEMPDASYYPAHIQQTDRHQLASLLGSKQLLEQHDTLTPQLLKRKLARLSESQEPRKKKRTEDWIPPKNHANSRYAKLTSQRLRLSLKVKTKQLSSQATGLNWRETEEDDEKEEIKEKDILDLLNSRYVTFKEEQENDEEIGRMLKLLKKEIPLSEASAKEKSRLKFCQLTEGILRYKQRPWIPTHQRKSMLFLCHDHSSGGHVGIPKLQERLQTRFYWPHMKREAKEWVNGCSCSRAKASRGHRVGKTQSFQSFAPYECLQADLVGPLPLSRSRNQFWLTLVDRRTRDTDLIPLKDAKATTVAKAIYTEWITRKGNPRFLLSDNGAAFVGKILKTLCNLTGTKNLYTSPYHPQANGMVERVHRFAGAAIRTLARGNSKIWDEKLPSIRFAILTSRIANSEWTPYQLAHGYKARLPADLIIRTEDDFPKEISEYYESLSKVQRIIQEEQDRFKAISDGRTRIRRNAKERRIASDLKVGDKVWYTRPYFNLTKIQRGTQKVLGKWKGPGTIVSRTSPNSYRVRTTEDLIMRFNCSDLSKIKTSTEPLTRENPDEAFNEDSDEEKHAPASVQERKDQEDVTDSDALILAEADFIPDSQPDPTPPTQSGPTLLDGDVGDTVLVRNGYYGDDPDQNDRDTPLYCGLVIEQPAGSIFPKVQLLDPKKLPANENEYVKFRPLYSFKSNHPTGYTQCFKGKSGLRKGAEPWLLEPIARGGYEIISRKPGPLPNSLQAELACPASKIFARYRAAYCNSVKNDTS